ncbi:MAG TPA: AraC family transcriptional regulator [Acetobacteraceae bacterium]|nr:AraC family transcriptional regulator [Acetobacteraceae bacterium]
MKRIRSSPPTVDRRTNAAFWVAGVADALAVEQLDVQGLFRDAGLDFAALDDPDARFAIDQVNLLWELALARSGNPAIGLVGAVQAKPRHFGIIAYALMSGPDLLGILHRMVRYVGILSDAAMLTVHKQRYAHRLVLTVTPGSRPAPHQRFAFDLLRFLSFCRWVTDTELKPAAVELSHPGGQSAPAFAAAFGCMPRFGAAENAVVFSATDATRPLPTADERLSAMHDRIATEHLQGMPGSLLKTRARALIAGHLPDGAPPRSAIAHALGMSERTLHRRLAEEGTSFQGLVDETRRELAENYLVRRDLSLAAVAYMLGFRDQGSFFRAAQRWLSMTPTQYRQRTAAAG